MPTRFAWIAAALLGLFLIFSWQQVRAVITADTPLTTIEGSAEYIFVAKMDKFFAEKPAMIAIISEDIKGKAPFRQLPVDLKVTDKKLAEKNMIAPLLKRLGP